MPYEDVLKKEATYVANLGSTATEDKLHALYLGILTTWFPFLKGYIVSREILGEAGKPRFIIVRHAGGYRNLLLVVELKRPAKWNDTGREEVLQKLTENMEGQFDSTQYSTIYGVGGIGLHWMACKMERGSRAPTTVLDWHSNISSNQSYDAFKTVAELVYNTH